LIPDFELSQAEPLFTLDKHGVRRFWHQRTDLDGPERAAR
jgi:hypothetical protein